MSNNYQFMKLGDILVKEDIITQSDLDKALVEKKNTREKLGCILIKNGVINEDDLVQIGNNIFNLTYPQNVLSTPSENLYIFHETQVD